MTASKYFVSYVTMDTDAGANPFWHASLILSTQDSPEHPIRVIDAVGFYSQPSTTTDPIIGGLKHILGFKIDLQDGHGILKKEKMRDLDGNGLHGIHFEATKQQFDVLQKRCAEKMRLEQEAILELNQHLHRRGEPQNGHTRHVEERSLAALEQREPRLKPFHIQMDLTSKGFDTRASYGCKNYALGLLLDVSIIDQSMHDQILGSPFKRAFPRYSDRPSEPVRLVSTGEPQQDISRHSRKVYYNRVWEQNQLFWATAIRPQNKLKGSTAALAVKDDVYPKLKAMLNQIREVETVLRHKITELLDTPSHTLRRDELKEQLARVMKLYELFSVSHENQMSPCLAAKLLQAETTLDVAKLSLTPNRVDHNFLMRAYTSIAARNALLGLLGILITATCFSGIVGAILVTTAVLYSGQQVYAFFKEEAKFASMRANYLAFRQAKPHINDERDESQDEEAVNASPV